MADSKLVLPCIALLVLLVAPAQAADFPQRPIRLIVPWPAGGTGDAVFRPLAAAAAKYLGQAVIVENKPGANGTIGVAALVQAKPDGYTLAQMNITVFTAAYTSKLSFDPVADVTYIMHVSDYVSGLAVRADSPWKTLEELVLYARSHPGEITYATAGPASPGHLAMEQLAIARDIRLTHVPFKGVSEALTAMLGGHVHTLASTSAWAPHVETGKLRLLATFGKVRTKRWPQVPTLKDLGLNIVSNSPFGVVGPKGMDPERVKVIHDAFRAALQDTATRRVMEQLDLVDDYMGPADYAAYARKLYKEQGEVIARLGLGSQ